MADVIMTFWNTQQATGILPHVIIPVRVEGSIGKIDMLIEYDTKTRGMAIQRIGGKNVANNLVKTPLGLVKQANASFKQVYGSGPDTPVLHLKSFRMYSDQNLLPYRVREYEVQDLTRIQDLFDYVTSVCHQTIIGNAAAGKSVPTNCAVAGNNVRFYNIFNNPVNPLSGMWNHHGDTAFRKSMINNGFTLIP